MPNPVQRALPTDTSVDRGNRSIVATINTAAVDRYNTVILPMGGRFDNYRRNAVVFYNHDACKLPIGKNEWIRASKRAIIAKTTFPPIGVNPDADAVFELYALGFLSAWSISFEPIEGGKPTPDEIRANPEWAAVDCVYREWELLEYSCVGVPGNPEAVGEARRRGLLLPGWPGGAAAAAPPPTALPPLVGRTLARVEGEVRRRARETAGSDALRRDVDDLARGMV